MAVVDQTGEKTLFHDYIKLNGLIALPNEISLNLLESSDPLLYISYLLLVFLKFSFHKYMLLCHCFNLY